MLVMSDGSAAYLPARGEVASLREAGGVCVPRASNIVSPHPTGCAGHPPRERGGSARDRLSHV